MAALVSATGSVWHRLPYSAACGRQVRLIIIISALYILVKDTEWVKLPCQYISKLTLFTEVLGILREYPWHISKLKALFMKSFNHRTVPIRRTLGSLSCHENMTLLTYFAFSGTRLPDQSPSIVEFNSRNSRPHSKAHPEVSASRSGNQGFSLNYLNIPP